MTTDGTTMTGDKRDTERGVLSPDGRFLAAPGESHMAVVLVAATKEPRVIYYGHQAGVYRRVCGTVRALAWQPDGRSIASGGADGAIHLWHARSGIHQRTLAQLQAGWAVPAST